MLFDSEEKQANPCDNKRRFSWEVNEAKALYKSSSEKGVVLDSKDSRIDL